MKFINIYSLDGQLAGSRRSKYRRHSNNQFGRLKRGSRFPSHFYNKVYIPNNWSVSYLFQMNQCFFLDNSGLFEHFWIIASLGSTRRCQW